ncbi:hypothetical protein CL629_03065 [bacterium]|nr:hypothetical protein [bacterium]
MRKDNLQDRLYFQNLRLQLAGSGEFLVRLLSYSSYILLVVGTAALFFSGVPRFRWLGIFLILFLIDRLMHLGEGERSVSNALRSKGNEKINTALFFSPASFRILSWAFRHAGTTGRDFSLILLKEFSERNEATRVFRRLGVSQQKFSKKLQELLDKPLENAQGDLFPLAERVACEAFLVACRTHETYIRPRTLFAAVALSKAPSVQALFRALNVSIPDVQEAVLMGRYTREFSTLRKMPLALGGFTRPSRLRRNRSMNRAWTAKPTPTLDQFSRDLTQLARSEKIGFLIGHSEEYEQMLDALSRPGKPNAILVGDPGVGKTTLLHHLAYRIVHDDVPKSLFDMRVVLLNVSQILSDASPDEVSGRLTRIADEIIVSGNVVVFVPRIHDLFKASEGGGPSPIDVFLPVVQSGAIPLVGETYSREFTQLVEPRSDFVEQFEVVRVEEMDKEEALRFLAYTALVLEREFRVFVTVKALRRVVEVAERYITNKPLPASAVDLLKESLGRAARSKKESLLESMVESIAEEELKMPIHVAKEGEAEGLLHLEDTIHKRLINQDEAVAAVSEALRQYRSGLSRQEGPIAAFLFVGPTGVGKTELSKILAEVQFGSRNTIRRYDMSEYQDRSSTFRLIGTPDGKTTGDLTDTIREHPYSLILLDEFEKAHPDILNLFLQVFDDGRLTDSLGRTVDFQNTIIVATSNAHSDFIKTEIERGMGAMDIADELKQKLTEYFKPELINRFSDIIVFRDLNKEEIYSVAKILLGNLQRRLQEAQGIDLLFDDSAVREIARLGYSKVFGARPLRKTISKEIRGQLARMVLKNEVSRGGNIRVSFIQGGFRFDTIE